jgi:hypothetical protein
MTPAGRRPSTITPVQSAAVQRYSGHVRSAGGSRNTYSYVAPPMREAFESPDRTDATMERSTPARLGHDFARIPVRADGVSDDGRLGSVATTGAENEARQLDRAAVAGEADASIAPLSGRSSNDTSIEPVTADNEFGDVTVDGGGAGSPVAGSAGGCGCCVDRVTIGNVTRIDNATHMGHSFDLSVAMNYPRDPGVSARPCQLQWWETTNVPAITGHAPNTRTNMFALLPTSPTFTPWNSRTNPCGGSETIVITDTPSLGKRPGRTVTRTLAFDIAVNSQGLCKNASKNATATQALTMVNGTPDWSASSFA